MEDVACNDVVWIYYDAFARLLSKYSRWEFLQIKEGDKEKLHYVYVYSRKDRKNDLKDKFNIANLFRRGSYQKCFDAIADKYDVEIIRHDIDPNHFDDWNMAGSNPDGTIYTKYRKDIKNRERELISIYHEIGHIIIGRKDSLCTLSIEGEAWNIAFRLSANDGFFFHDFHNVRNNAKDAYRSYILKEDNTIYEETIRSKY